MKKQADKNIKSIFFVFMGLVLLVSYLVVIGNYQNFIFRTYKYKIILPNSEELFIGSYASINGLRAGSISEIELQGNKVLLTLAIKKKFVKFINQSSIASLKTQGILGDKYIYIETKKEAPLLPEGAFIKTHRVGGGEDITQMVQEIATQVNIFLKNLNNQEGGARDLGGVVGQINKLLSDQNSQNVEDILKHLKSILKKIDRGQGTAGALINSQELHKTAVSALGQESYSNMLKFIFRKKKPQTTNE